MSSGSRHISDSKERLWNANYLRAWSANFTLFFSFMLIVPLLPIYLQEEYGASKDVIGVVLSGYTVVALLTRATSGYVVDHYPRKQVLVLGFVLLTAFFAGYLAAGSLLLFACVRTLHGMPFGLATVSNSTVAIDVLPASRRAEGIGYYGLSNNVATAISPTIGLWLYDTFHDFDILFCASMGVALLGTLSVACIKTTDELIIKNEKLKIDTTDELIIKSEKLKIDTSAGTIPSVTDNSPIPQPSARDCEVTQFNHLTASGANRFSFNFSFLDHFFLTAAWRQAVAIACYSFAYGVVSTYVAIYGREELDIQGGSGLFFALLASGLIMSRLVGSRTLRRGLVVRNASIGVSISCVGYLLFALLHNEVGYYGAALLIGLGNGHLWPAFQTMFINLGPSSKRGTANASLLTSWDLGVGIGVISGGFAIEHFGYHTAFLCAWLVEALGVLFYFVKIRGYRSSPEP